MFLCVSSSKRSSNHSIPTKHRAHTHTHQQSNCVAALPCVAVIRAQFDRVYPSMDAELAAFATFTANHAWVMAQNAASSSPNAPFGQGVQFKLNQVSGDCWC